MRSKQSGTNRGNLFVTENEVVRESIAQSLLLLMESESLDRITVVELTRKAGVSRMSFYRNFESKEDVLAAYTERVFRDFLHRIPDFTELKVLEDSKIFFSYLRHYELLMKNLVKANLFGIFSDIFSQYFATLFVDVYKLDRNSDYRSYELTYRVGGLANIIFIWVQNDFRETDEQMANVFRYLYEL